MVDPLVIAVALAWAVVGLLCWLGYQLVLQNGRLLLRLWFIPPDQAAALMAERLGLTPTRAAAALVRVSRRARRVASWLFPLPGQVHGLLQPF